MDPIHYQLQFSNDPVALAEWFAASIALVIVVTLIYVFVLNRSPPPEGPTVSKLEQQQQNKIQLGVQNDPQLSINEAKAALQSGRYADAVESAVGAIEASLSNVLRAWGTDPKNMNISDLAYLVEARSTSSRGGQSYAPQFASSVYQLNNLRLESKHGRVIQPQEASWAISFASWVMGIARSGQIRT